MTAHRHDASCYADHLSCAQREHQHNPSCWNTTVKPPELTCATPFHEHNRGCYRRATTCGYP